MGQLGDANEVLNERAVAVMARMSNKLTGHDFMPTNTMPHVNDTLGDRRELEPGLTVKIQVQKLIMQAMSHENLCQSYVGCAINLSLSLSLSLLTNLSVDSAVGYDFFTFYEQ